MKFTVGLAVYDDLVRAELTIQHLLNTHGYYIGEIIVVDNHPENTKDAAKLKAFCEKSSRPGPNISVRYIEMATPKGTASPRNRVFAEATQKHTVCIDPHVQFYNNAFPTLIKFYGDMGEDCPDLLHGPMMTEAGIVYGDHFNYQWRSQMLGTWGRVWMPPNGRLFSVRNPTGNVLEYVTVDDATPDGTYQRVLSPTEVRAMKCNPQIGWAGHEKVLLDSDCKWSLQLSDDFRYRSPGQGMGAFACRTDAWLPFTPDHRGFGAEEITTDMWFRANGRECWTLNGFRWWHHFEREVVPYRIFVWDKVRNYVLAFDRLNRPLDEIYQHFVVDHHPGKDRAMMPEAEWLDLMNGVNWPARKIDARGNPYASYVEKPVDIPDNDPNRRYVKRNGSWVRADTRDTGMDFVVYDTAASNGPSFESIATSTHPWPEEKFVPRAGCAGTGETGDAVGERNLTAFYEAVCRKPTDLNEHLPVLKELAETCGPDGKPGHVVELQIGAGHTSAAFLMARVPMLTSYDRSIPVPALALQKMVFPGQRFRTIQVNPLEHEIPECDLLFVDLDERTALRVYNELVRHHERVRHYIVIHDTTIAAETYNGNPGLLPGVRTFIKNHPMWTTIRQYHNNNGLLVMSRDDRDKQQPPGMLRKALNFASSVMNHVQTGRRITPQDEYIRRTDICLTCEKRWHEVCGECGCPFEVKAGWADQECGMRPESGPKKWLALPVVPA